MKICFTGDVILLEEPGENYWNDNELLQRMKDCDVRCGNLEMVLSADKAFASTYCGGQWLTADEDKLDLLMRFGFDYFNTANNHAMDFSYEGLALTNQALDSRGILHSGTGASLKEAASPVYKEIGGKKIAFLSCTASCDDAARAGDPSKTIPARPGVNMLRHGQKLHVTQDVMKVIDQVAQDSCINARFMKSVQMGTHRLDPDVHRLGRLEFVIGERNEKVTSCNRSDLKRMTDAVKDAKKEADLVFVSVHSHDIKGMSDDTADDYHEEFTRACIDAGASAVISTGTHQLKGIEVYKGCPIFYSLGNFIFREELFEFAPADIYERYHLPLDASAEELYLARTKNGTSGLMKDPMNYRSIVPVFGMKEGKIGEVSLIPVELNFEYEENKGLPKIADEEVSKEIFERLCRLSGGYGTSLTLRDGMITVSLND